MNHVFHHILEVVEHVVVVGFADRSTSAPLANLRAAFEDAGITSQNGLGFRRDPFIGKCLQLPPRGGPGDVIHLQPGLEDGHGDGEVIGWCGHPETVEHIFDQAAGVDRHLQILLRVHRIVAVLVIDEVDTSLGDGVEIHGATLAGQVIQRCPVLGTPADHITLRPHDLVTELGVRFAVAQHLLGEAGGLGRQHGKHFRRALPDGARKGGELDFGHEIHAAGHRAQRIGQALFFPTIRFAALGIECVERGHEVTVKPVPAFDRCRLLHARAPR